MSSIGNNVNFIGRLTKEPEIKMTSGDRAFCNFCLARNRAYNKDKEHPESDFVDCIAWGKTAELIGKYFNKGSRIGISGYLQTRIYENSNGFKVKAVEIVVENIEFIDYKSSNQENKASNEAMDTQHSSNDTFEEYQDTDDDLPF